MAQYLDPSMDDPFPSAFQRQFKRSLALPGEPQQGGGGGPMPIPEGGPGNWKRTNENQGGGGGPMPIPEGDPWWQDLRRDMTAPMGTGGPMPSHLGMPTPQGDPWWQDLRRDMTSPTGTGGFHPGGQFLGGGGGALGGGGPMPIPDDNWRVDRAMAADRYPINKAPASFNTNANYWNAVGNRAVNDMNANGGSWEDYGMASEFGGPGAVNAPGGIANQRPQAPAQPQGRQPYNFAQQSGFQRPQRGGNDRGVTPQNVVDGTGQRHQILPMRDPRNFRPPPPAANPQGNPAQPANTGGFNFQQTFKKPAGNWDWSNLGNILNRRF